MGWLVGWRTKKDLVEHLLRNDGGNCEVIDHSLVDNHLWMVCRIRKSEDPAQIGFRFIVLCLLSGGPRGTGPAGRDWGYKDVEESMGPCKLDCPERLLAQSDCQDRHAPEWRQACREARAAKAESRKFIAGLKPGDKFAYGSLEVVFTRRYEVHRRGRRMEKILGAVEGGDGAEYRWSKSRIRPLENSHAL